MTSSLAHPDGSPVRALVVDDEPMLGDILRMAMRYEGWDTRLAHDGQTALRMAREVPPDVVVLDVMMPDIDGLTVLRRLREAGSEAPVLFLTAKDSVEDRIAGLTAGGDDYVTKPFSPREVVARVGAILRRLKQPVAKASDSASLPALQHGNLRIDNDGFKAYWGELEITLTVTEFNILTTLARRTGKVFTRDELMEGAYEDSRYVSDRTIDSHVRRIRKKFMARGGDPIETRRGVGYILTACD